MRNKIESLSIIVNRDAQKSLSERGTTEDLWWKCNLDVFKVMGSSFQTIGAATEKEHLSKLSFVLGTISCYEIDDMSCLWIFERCRRLAK